MQNKMYMVHWMISLYAHIWLMIYRNDRKEHPNDGDSKEKRGGELKWKGGSRYQKILKLAPWFGPIYHIYWSSFAQFCSGDINPVLAIPKSPKDGGQLNSNFLMNSSPHHTIAVHEELDGGLWRKRFLNLKTLEITTVNPSDSSPTLTAWEQVGEARIPVSVCLQTLAIKPIQGPAEAPKAKPFKRTQVKS